jgi:hypothetical protein
MILTLNVMVASADAQLPQDAQPQVWGAHQLLEFSREGKPSVTASRENRQKLISHGASLAWEEV